MTRPLGGPRPHLLQERVMEALQTQSKMMATHHPQWHTNTIKTTSPPIWVVVLTLADVPENVRNTSLDTPFSELTNTS